MKEYDQRIIGLINKLPFHCDLDGGDVSGQLYQATVYTADSREPGSRAWAKKSGLTPVEENQSMQVIPQRCATCKVKTFDDNPPNTPHALRLHSDGEVWSCGAVVPDRTLLSPHQITAVSLILDKAKA